MEFKPIQPVIITPFKRELIISSHLFRFLRKEADYRGISPSETARQLILSHLDLSDEKQLMPLIKSRINALHKSYKDYQQSSTGILRISSDGMIITVLANALTVIELIKLCKRNKK